MDPKGKFSLKMTPKLNISMLLDPVVLCNEHNDDVKKTKGCACGTKEKKKKKKKTQQQQITMIHTRGIRARKSKGLRWMFDQREKNKIKKSILSEFGASKSHESDLGVFLSCIWQILA